MFERYTERARRVLFFARYEASQLGSVTIESEHLLLGLLRENKGLTSRIFARHHLSFPEIRQAIESRTVVRSRISTSVEIPFSPDTMAILQCAAGEADGLRHDYIGTEHLLLGIVRVEQSAAASVLIERGLRLESVRHDIEQLLSEKASTHRSGQAPPAVATRGRAAIEPPHTPAYLPSEIVHISVTTHAAPGVWFSESPRHWHISGAAIQPLMARAYGTEEDRVVLPPDMTDATRYDVMLLLPGNESATAIARRIRQALETQLQITAAREARPEGEVLVVSRTDAAHPR